MAYSSTTYQSGHIELDECQETLARARLRGISNGRGTADVGLFIIDTQLL